MDLHAASRACHHSDGLVRFSKGFDDMRGYIVVISKPSNKDPGTEITEGLVLDAELLDRVFKVPVTTVKCIPHGCRLAFSQALKAALCKVVAQPDSVDAWVRLLLFPRCTLQVYIPKNRQERRSGNRKSLQQSSILKSLATWENDDGIAMQVKSILDGSALGSFSQVGGDFLKEGATSNTNIKQCLRKVADGHFTEAVKVLSSSGVAPYCDDTIKALEAKHPYKPPPSMPNITFSEPPLGSATATNLLKVITSVVNLWLAGRCPPILAEFAASAPLMHLLKLDNRIRPIAVGTIWRRLVSKVAMKGVGKEMSKYLSDFQFGVGMSGGTEAILHSVNRELSEYHNDGSLAMLTVDFSNAFNLVDRSTLLHEASRLYIGDIHIWFATGVQQGDSLGPLLFALILHPLLHKIKDSCKLLLHAWYLDDGTVIGDSEEVARVLDLIKVSGPGLGLELNIKKTKIFWPSCNGMKLRESLFPIDIQRPSLGVKLLGGAVSKDTYFISGLAMRRAENVVDLMSFLPQLHDPQTSRAQSWVLQDHILRNSGICGIDDDYVSALACLRDTIPSYDFSDIQSAGSDTRPPMLDRFNFESWQQYIRLYCLGKENKENILQSIDEGLFKMGKFRETLADGALGPERDKVVKDLTPEERKRYKADIRATNILLQGLPKDIYTLINHYTNAKDIWDNVKMPLEGSELTRDERLQSSLMT
ncbi:putative reverse transcriptase domain-containing protein [Tanacetum coccineum]